MRRLALSVLLLTLAAAAGAEDTTITGDRMELVDKGNQVIFSGGVHLVRGPDDMRATEMRTNKTRDKITAKGKVRLVRKASSTETWKGFGDVGHYETDTGTGYLLGTRKQARLIRDAVTESSATQSMDIIADRIDFSREPQRAYARGKVYGKTIDPKSGETYEFYAAEAEYRGSERRVILLGLPRPVILQTGLRKVRRVTGDRIIYYIDERRLISEGSAQAYTREEK